MAFLRQVIKTKVVSNHGWDSLVMSRLHQDTPASSLIVTPRSWRTSESYWYSIALSCQLSVFLWSLIAILIFWIQMLWRWWNISDLFHIVSSPRDLTVYCCCCSVLCTDCIGCYQPKWNPLLSWETTRRGEEEEGGSSGLVRRLRKEEWWELGSPDNISGTVLIDGISFYNKYISAADLELWPWLHLNRGPENNNRDEWEEWMELWTLIEWSGAL